MDAIAIQFAASLVAVAAMVLVVHLAGFSRSARLLSEQEARDIAQLAPGGFCAVRIALDKSGRGAIAADAAGRLVLLRPHGAHFVPEAVEPAAVRCDGDALLVDSQVQPAIQLAIGPDAVNWAQG